MGCFSSKEARHEVINDYEIEIKKVPDAPRSHATIGSWNSVKGLSIRGSTACLPLEGSPIITTHQSCVTGSDYIFLFIFEAHSTTSSAASNEVARYLNKRAHSGFMSTNPLDKGDAYVSIALRETLLDLNRSLQAPSPTTDASSSPRSPRVSMSSMKKMRRGTAAGALIFINLRQNTVAASASGGMVVALSISSGALSRKTTDFTAIADCRRQRLENGITSGLMGPDCEPDVISGSASLGPSVESVLVMSAGLLDLISVYDATCLSTCLNDPRLHDVNISNQIVQQASIQRSDSRRNETDATLIAFSLSHPKSETSKVNPDQLEKISLAKQRWRLLKCYLRFRFLRSRSLLQVWSTVGRQLLRQAEANARKAEERAWLENAEVIEVSRNGAIRRSSQGAARTTQGNGQSNYMRVSAGGIGRHRISASGNVQLAGDAPEATVQPLPVADSALHLADVSLTPMHENDKSAMQDQVAVQDQAKLKPKGLPVPLKKILANRSSKSHINLRGQDLTLP